MTPTGKYRTGKYSFFVNWVHTHHEHVWDMWINDESSRSATDYFQAEHPHLWVAWRMYGNNG